MSGQRSVPLYRGVDVDIRALSGLVNWGLVYNKFPNEWRKQFQEFGKEEWLKTFCVEYNKKCHQTKRWLEELNGRVEDVRRAMDGLSFELTTTSRFVTGLGLPHPIENGFAWHHTLGVPYIPGTTLKGAARSWARDYADDVDDEASVLGNAFGPEQDGDGGVASGSRQVGDLIFLDALPIAPPSLDIEYMTPHYGPYYQNDVPPADWYNPTPIPYLTVASGATFRFVVLSRSRNRDMVRRGVRWLAEALTTIGIGAKTASGYGLFERRQSASPPWEFPPEEVVWENCKLERRQHRGMISLTVTGPDGQQVVVDSAAWQPKETHMAQTEREQFIALKEGRLRATVTVRLGEEPKLLEFKEFRTVDG